MISIIIPHFNQPDALARCLASLARQEACGHEVEILVVDNGSDALPEAQVAAHPAARLLREPEPGPGPARNRGVAEAKGEILAFIDADCVAHPGWLESIARHMEAGAEILGGDVRILHRTPGRPGIWEAYESEFAYRMEHYIARQGFTGTGNMAVRAGVMAAVGPFAGIGTAEDRDWGRRATAQGHTITWAPDMIAYHPARESFAELARKWDRHIAHDYALYRQRRFGRLRWLLRALMVAASPVASSWRVLASRRIEGGWRGRLKAILGLTRLRLYRARRMLGLLLSRGGGLENRWREKGGG